MGGGGHARRIGATSRSEFIIIIYYHRYYYRGTEDAKSPALAAKLTTKRGQRLFADRLQTAAAAAAEDTNDWPAETVWKRSQTSCRRGHAKQFMTAAQTDKSYLQPPYSIIIIYYPNNKFYAKIWLRNELRVGEKTTDKSSGVLAIDRTKNIIIMIYDEWWRPAAREWSVAHTCLAPVSPSSSQFRHVKEKRTPVDFRLKLFSCAIVYSIHNLYFAFTCFVKAPQSYLKRSVDWLTSK